MDTGFRRYDGSLMPVRRPDRTFTFIFSGNSIENTCAEMIRATNSQPVPSYPRKRVSKLVLPKTNLDSRLRGNDKSRRGACKGNSLQYLFPGRLSAHGHFVVNRFFAFQPGPIPWHGHCV